MILIDNTVLSNFALTGSLRSVRRFCRGRGLTTRIVYEEFQAGVESGFSMIRIFPGYGSPTSETKRKNNVLSATTVV